MDTATAESPVPKSSAIGGCLSRALRARDEGRLTAPKDAGNRRAPDTETIFPLVSSAYFSHIEGDVKLPDLRASGATKPYLIIN